MNRAGTYVTNLSGSLAYESYKPASLPPAPALDIDISLAESLAAAKVALAKLDAASNFVPSVDLFLSAYIRKEALLTSQIEGTQCTLEDVFNPYIDANTNLDVSDVVNYVNAFNFALQRMDTLPISVRLFCETHRVLMQSGRGKDKNPGEMRTSQNWIGPTGCTLKEALFVPPNVDDMHDAMSDLEKYINNEEAFDPLIIAALMHYQFETIHPFLDGNGRIGRLAILLYLLNKNCLSKPVLYVSYFLKKNQVEYYDRMSEVRKSGNYEQWVLFFLRVLEKAATDSLDTIEKLEKLHNKNLAQVNGFGARKNSAAVVFAYIEQHPICDISIVAGDLGLSYNTVAAAFNKMVSCGILREITKNARNKVYVYEDYLAILQDGIE